MTYAAKGSMRRAALLSVLALSTGFALIPDARAAGQVNVYSFRQPYLIKPLLARFSKQTGIKVRFLFAKKGLIERLAREGRNSPADVVLSADAGRLIVAADRGLARPVTSPAILKAVPANLRDSKNRWFALTMRARVIYASKDRVKDTAMSYESLADPKWKGKICIRSGLHRYNTALFATYLAHKGPEATKAWLTGLKANLARRPSGNDRAQAKGVYAGECDIGIANTYYLGKMLNNEKDPEQKKWAKAVRIIFPTSPEIGTHVNISGMFMAANAPHPGAALKLMEFLAGNEAQALYAAKNYEYPVNPAVSPSPLVRSWGKMTPDSLPVETMARKQKAAGILVDDTGFNE